MGMRVLRIYTISPSHDDINISIRFFYIGLTVRTKKICSLGDLIIAFLYKNAFLCANNQPGNYIGAQQGAVTRYYAHYVKILRTDIGARCITVTNCFIICLLCLVILRQFVE